MEKEFKSLSDWIVNKLKRGTGGYAGKGLRADYVETKNIKEFIKIILEEVDSHLGHEVDFDSCLKDIKERVIKEAGDKLI